MAGAHRLGAYKLLQPGQLRMESLVRQLDETTDGSRKQVFQSLANGCSLTGCFLGTKAADSKLEHSTLQTLGMHVVNGDLESIYHWGRGNPSGLYSPRTCCFAFSGQSWPNQQWLFPLFLDTCSILQQQNVLQRIGSQMDKLPWHQSRSV